ncbi:MAG: hypothetical protein ACO1NO_11740, partial [Burkholderiaceae bacterium]
MPALFLATLFLTILVATPSSFAQTAALPVLPKPAPAAAPEAEKKDEAPPVVTIPVADIAVQSETALLNIRQLQSEAAASEIDDTMEEDLEALSRAIVIRTVEMRRLLLQNASIDAIRDLERSWAELEERTGAVTAELTQSALELDKAREELETIEATWTATRAAAEAEAAPAAIISRIGDITAAAAKAKKRMLQRRADILSLQAKSANLQARASQ